MTAPPPAPAEPEISTSYAVCAVHRSGSSLLCELLWLSGAGGWPAEYFYLWEKAQEDGYGPASRVHWQWIPWAERERITTWSGFAGGLRRHVSLAGVFGVKLMWSYFGKILRGLRGESDALRAATDHEVLSSALPKLRYVWLSRRDTVRQAVSWALAEQTGIWSSQTRHPGGEPRYDFDQIDRLYRAVVDGDRGWRNYFETHGIEPCRVVYEEMLADREGTVRRVLDFLGIEGAAGVPVPPPSTTELATGRNDEWAARYRAQLQRAGETPGS